ncbi:hypothetical protein MUK42_34046 [Musa troglodytarum]|uniref:Uncharacterized protein n=1 Tax=Musa troglodytarum TaxID=320322 RepID=A0A9E7JY33_9LILI|nr:hypothetical protein MUK42_34046 [Musa troglodytarum]
MGCGMWLISCVKKTVSIHSRVVKKRFSLRWLLRVAMRCGESRAFRTTHGVERVRRSERDRDAKAPSYGRSWNFG